jgi:hypothetical protein
MKVKLGMGNHQIQLFLTPETKEDEADIKNMVLRLSSHQYMIGAQGFRYMDPEVCFLMQPRGRDD